MLPRWLLIVLTTIGVATLLIAIITIPIADWDRTTWILAIVTAVATATWLFYAIRGNADLLGSWSARTGAVIAAIGAFGSGIVIGAVVFTEGWSVNAVLMTGFFAAIAVMFAAMFWISANRMKAQAASG
jgi:hypothetical protein